MSISTKQLNLDYYYFIFLPHILLSLTPSELPRDTTSIPTSTIPTIVLYTNSMFIPVVLPNRYTQQYPSDKLCSPPHTDTRETYSLVPTVFLILETNQIPTSLQVFKPSHIPTSSPSLDTLPLYSDDTSPKPIQDTLPAINTPVVLGFLNKNLQPLSATK